jgi:hypothetical protein
MTLIESVASPPSDPPIVDATLMVEDDGRVILATVQGTTAAMTGTNSDDEQQEQQQDNTNGNRIQPNGTASSGDSQLLPSLSTISPSPSPLYLIRFVKQGKFLDCTDVLLFPRNGQPSQEWRFYQGKLENPSTGRLLAAEWSDDKRAYTGFVVFLPSKRDEIADDDAADQEQILQRREKVPADWTWEFTTDGTIRHRASGKLLCVCVSWRGFLLCLRQGNRSELHQWQLLPVDLVVG